jgi:hypothetical protein
MDKLLITEANASAITTLLAVSLKNPALSIDDFIVTFHFRDD